MSLKRKPAPLRRASTAEAPPQQGSVPPPPPALKVRVIWGDLAQVEGAVLLVGHYAGLRPLHAEEVLDRWVSAPGAGDEGRLLITELARRGVLRGELGELLFFPGPNGRLGAVAGMGQPGTFAAPQARRLARTVAQTVGLLPWHDTLTTVVIGSGDGNLPIEQAAREFLTALVEALDADPSLSLRELNFVENSLDRALRIADALSSVATKLKRRSNRLHDAQIDPFLGECPGGRVPHDFGCSMLLAALAADDAHARDVLPKALDALPIELRDAVGDWLRHRVMPGASRTELRRSALRFRLMPDEAQAGMSAVPVRITATHDGPDLRVTAITASTTVTERVLVRKLPLAQRAGERTRHARPAERAEAGRRLRRHLLHSDFRVLLEGLDPLVLELDAETAALPWEMLPAGEADRAIALQRPVARQLRTRYSPRPFELPRRSGWRALVVGDPASGSYALPSSRDEALEVAQLLTDRGLHCTLMLGAPDPGTGAGPLDGIAAADYAELVDCLLSGEYDLVHFCGHAVHEPQRPERSGWVFEDAQLLTGADLEGAERPPRLVFANACATAQLQQSASMGLLEGLVDSYFQRGVRHYIGTAWSVPSEAARRLALAFYGSLFGAERCSIGEALLAARQSVSADEDLLPAQQEDSVAATWAAYQHYGDPTERFDRPSEAASNVGLAAVTRLPPHVPKPRRRKAK